MNSITLLSGIELAPVVRPVCPSDTIKVDAVGRVLLATANYAERFIHIGNSIFVPDRAFGLNGKVVFKEVG